MRTRIRLVAALLIASVSVSAAADAKGWRTSARHRRHRAERAAAATAAAAAYATWYASLDPKAKRIEDWRTDLRRRAAMLRLDADNIRVEAYQRRIHACDRSWWAPGCEF